jgi:hypothetical protein|tara:strand:+ start:1703 stop:3637 length:1935 start_codon:yes stop_codon:yes gene_type:complete
MDPITQQQALAAAGAGGDKVYVDDVFHTHVYTGYQSTTAVNNGLDMAGEGGLLWIKNRTNTTTDHNLVDSERGTSQNLASNTTSSQFSDTLVNGFNSNGYTLEGAGSNILVNNSSHDYVAWAFRKCPGFFDCVKYTGTGSTRTVAHSLGSTPGVVIVRSVTGGDWAVWHRSISTGTVNRLLLQTEDGAAGSSYTFTTTSPTSTHFTVGSSSTSNQSGNEYIAYIFAHDDQQFGKSGNEAIIKCGSYTGDGTSDSNYVELGFEPQWLLIKNTSRDQTVWKLCDIWRDLSWDGGIDQISPNDKSSTATASGIKLTPTGFIPQGSGTYTNYSGDSFAYIAIRRPNKPAEAATDVYQTDTDIATSPSPPQFTAGFPPDLAIRRDMSGSHALLSTRLMGQDYVFTSINSGESSGSALQWDFHDGWSQSSDSANTNLRAYMFKRNPGFLDVVRYKSAGTAENINHNLGSVPKMIWVKRVNAARSWNCYHEDIGAGKVFWLDDNGIPINSTGSSSAWNETAPTSSTFRVGGNPGTSGGGDQYLALLWGDSEFSKVGSYTGTGSAGNNIDCGFTNGARFVIVKRTDASGDWFVADTGRGINTGSDPFFKLNTTDAQNNTVDWIDAYSAGFTINGTGGDYNASGGTYVFLAIA